jgi:hypothetical protein
VPGRMPRDEFMRRLYFAALPFALLAGPALAEPSCQGDGPMMPMWQVAKSFEETGGTIREIKTTNGCYEIYGHEQERRVEVFFDPRSGSELARE